MTISKWRSMLVASMLLVAPIAACASAPVDQATDAVEGATDAVANAVSGSRLDTVIGRGTLICGVEGSIPGFSFVESASSLF